MPATAELDNELKALEINPKACLPQLEQPTDEPDSDAPATDAHVESGVAVAPPESSAKPEIAELSSSEDSSSGAAESAADEKQTMPQLHNKELAELLDESTGDLVALKDFDGEVDHRAFEPNWFGRHPDHILVAIRAKLLRKGRYTAHIDAAGNLLSDPEEYRLAIALGVQITLCIHREPSADKKLEFILRSQTGNRFCSRKETEELKSHLMLVWIRLGVDYATIAKMANVCPNTVRNVETRAAADTNSKVGFTKRPDGRYKPETREKIAQASRLRAEGKDNSEIAKALDTDPDSVGKWLKDPPAEGTTKNKDKPSKKPKASRGDSEAEPKDMTDAIAPVDSVPDRHRGILKHLGKTDQDYTNLDTVYRDQAREDIAKIYSDDAELLYCAIYGKYLTSFAEELLEKRLRSIDAEDRVDEAPGIGNLDGAEYEAGEILTGTAPDIEPSGVLVSPPNGDGGVNVVDGDSGLARHTLPEEEGKEARVCVNDFDSELELAGRKSMPKHDCAMAVEPDLDERSSPYKKHFGRRARTEKK